LVLAFTTLHKWPLLLSHYGISDTSNAPSAAQTNVKRCDTSAKQCNLTQHTSNTKTLAVVSLEVLHPSAYSPALACQTVSCLDCWSYIWEVTDTTKGWKWKFLFVNNCKCKALISTAKLDLSRKRSLVNRIRDSECCIWKYMVAVIAKSEVPSPSLYRATWGK
jgi:hypothetical protein